MRDYQDAFSSIFFVGYSSCDTLARGFVIIHRGIMIGEATRHNNTPAPRIRSSSTDKAATIFWFI